MKNTGCQLAVCLFDLGSIGVGYFIYGKKQQSIVPLLPAWSWSLFHSFAETALTCHFFV